MQTIPTITAQQAQAIANLLLSDHLPDRFTADQPQCHEAGWQVPIILAYPTIGAIGQVGEVWVDLTSEQILSHTDFATMRATGQNLYTRHQDAIETALS
jgi:hypothetical protein